MSMTVFGAVALRNHAEGMNVAGATRKQAGKSINEPLLLFFGHNSCKQFSSVDSSRGSSLRQGKRVLPVSHQQVISASHPLPVIFVGSSTKDTALIVLPTAAASGPSKPMGAQFSKETLPKPHVCRSFPRARATLGGATCCEKWRVNRF
jgi:hypothetical protein